MSLYEEAMKETIEEAADASGYDAQPESNESYYRFQAPDLSFLKAPTGEGAIEEYLTHPLNFDGKKSTGRIIRGLTGLLGALDYAIIDLILGLIEKWKEKGTPTNENRP